MSKDNGGPAFGELQQVGDVAMRDGGMTLRDSRRDTCTPTPCYWSARNDRP